MTCRPDLVVCVEGLETCFPVAGIFKLFVIGGELAGLSKVRPCVLSSTMPGEMSVSMKAGFNLSMLIVCFPVDVYNSKCLLVWDRTGYGPSYTG